MVRAGEWQAANDEFPAGNTNRAGELHESGMNNLKTGDYVKFGSYPQNNIAVKESIEWLVLDVNGNEALLVSRYGLDCKRYHHEFTEITLENCDLRKWLLHQRYRRRRCAARFMGESLIRSFSEQEALGKYVCSISGYAYDPADHDEVP